MNAVLNKILCNNMSRQPVPMYDRQDDQVFTKI